MARQSDITTDNDTSYNRWFYAQFHRHVFRHRSHNMPIRVYVTVGCPSVRPSVLSFTSGGFAAERRADRRYRSAARQTVGIQQQRRRCTRPQHGAQQQTFHVHSQGMRLNTDLLHTQYRPDGGETVYACFGHIRPS